MKYLLRICLLAIFLSTSVACSSSSDDEKVETRTAEELYNDAMDSLTSKSYGSAIKDFQEIERQYPYSPWATRAQVMVAYAHYRQQNYNDAVDVIEQFTRLNPGNKNIPYMYYLLSLSYYEQIADVRRDQGVTEKALAALRDVNARFPDSPYAKDARLKLDLALDHLAGKEMEIGRFYQRQGKYISAINRFKLVVQRYESTSHVTEALYRLTETYLALGVTPEAKKYASVLGHNYPQSKWYKYAYRLVEEGKNSPKKPSKPSWFEEAITFEQTEDAYNCSESQGGCKSTNSGKTWIEDLFE